MNNKFSVLDQAKYRADDIRHDTSKHGWKNHRHHRVSDNQKRNGQQHPGS